MLVRMLAALAALMVMAASAEARRVALVIGENAYPGGSSATVGLATLHNPVRDARRMADLLAKHGFEVIACDGTTPGCFDLDNTRFLEALARFERRAAGADLALVFFAGHGTATPEGNILAPIDARVNCAAGAITHGVPMERIMAATRPARHKLVILDACRNDPLGDVCPGLRGKKLTFTRIEAGATRSFLLVTSPQFGQEALDGPPGHHSPFAVALFAALEANPNVYFDQVLNEVARATHEAAQKHRGFLQIPGRVVGGEAPADCLAGRACVGDPRMAALAVENERLAADASGVRSILAAEEQARGKAYTAEERQKRVAELQETLARMGTSTDPLRLEARRLIDEGNVAGGRAKLDAALDADEKAIAEAERVAAKRRKAAAQSARDLGVLARGSDVVKAVTYFERATKLDPADPWVWLDYGESVRDAGRLDDAKRAFEQAAHAGRLVDSVLHIRATYRQSENAHARGNLSDALHLALTARDIGAQELAQAPDNLALQRELSVAHAVIGDVLRSQGSLGPALEAYRAAHAIFERLASANPGNAGWQRDLSLSQSRIGDVLRAQGNLTAALESFRASVAVAERLAKADPGNTVRLNLSASLNRVGDVLRSQGDLTAALESFRASLAIVERLAKADPANTSWQLNLSASLNRVGDVLRAQGDLNGALESNRASLVIAERLAKADPANTSWQLNLSASLNQVGDVLQAQGNLNDALESHRASLAIAERLGKADPGNTSWQHNLSVSHGRTGDVLRDQGNLAAALESYRARHAIAERLAKSDRSNAEWQRDLAWSHARIGDVLRAQGNLTAALESYRASLAIRELLAKADPGDAAWQLVMSASHERIGDVLRDQGNLNGALDSYRASLAIYERLANENALWLHNVALGYRRVALVLVQQGARSEAALAFEQGRAIILRLREISPYNAALPGDLAWFEAQLAALKN